MGTVFPFTEILRFIIFPLLSRSTIVLRVFMPPLVPFSNPNARTMRAHGMELKAQYNGRRRACTCWSFYALNLSAQDTSRTPRLVHPHKQNTSFLSLQENR